MKKLDVVVIGAGSRGMWYSGFMHDMNEKYNVVAVAEPIESRRKYIQDMFDLPDERCFDDWKPLFDLGKIADLALIATMDREHYAPAMKAIELKYDLIMEKPISVTPKECKEITDYAKKQDVKVVICTVLRYTSIFIKLKEMIDNGTIGKVVSINHEECVGNVHMSHSFIRGNWGNSKRSSVMLLQKSCHDMDILQWLTGKKCKKVQSFGSLRYFTRENAPEGSPEYCIEGCSVADTCPYNAVKLYLDTKENIWFRQTCGRGVHPNDDEIRRAISETQYGKCVFKCDNDVVDRQTVNMLFEDDIVVTFIMNPFNEGGRFMHIMGTKGEIHAALDGDSPIELYEYEGEKHSEIPIIAVDGINGGHGGGDEGIIRTVYDYINGTYNGDSVPTIEESYYSHMITFAADESRLRNGETIDVDEFIKESESI